MDEEQAMSRVSMVKVPNYCGHEECEFKEQIVAVLGHPFNALVCLDCLIPFAVANTERGSPDRRRLYELHQTLTLWRKGR